MLIVVLSVPLQPSVPRPVVNNLKMERLDKPTEGQKSANMTFHADKVSGNVVLTVRDAAIGYDDEILSEPISLDVKKMDAIAIVGPNGIG